MLTRWKASLGGRVGFQDPLQVFKLLLRLLATLLLHQSAHQAEEQLKEALAGHIGMLGYAGR